jgi:putative transposase
MNQDLMRRLGLDTIYRKPRLSLPGRQHKRYPYLLNGMIVDRTNQAWASDITYVRLAYRFVYPAAIMDWYSRYVISWTRSTTLDTGFCRKWRSRSFDVHGKNGFRAPKWIEWSQEAGLRSTFRMPPNCPKNGERVNKRALIN